MWSTDRPHTELEHTMLSVKQCPMNNGSRHSFVHYVPTHNKHRVKQRGKLTGTVEKVYW